jgi:predicted XRE-type DNA-binding protein
MEHEIAYTVSGSNLFADGELPDAAALYVKSRLCVAIREEMKNQELTQGELAAKSGVHQPRISKICGQNTEGISIDIILRVVEALGYDVEPVLKKRQSKKVIYVDDIASDRQKASLPKVTLRRETAKGSDQKLRRRKKVLA